MVIITATDVFGEQIVTNFFIFILPIEAPFLNQAFIQFKIIPYFQINGFGGETIEYNLNNSYIESLSPYLKINYKISQIFQDEIERFELLAYGLTLYNNSIIKATPKLFK